MNNLSKIIYNEKAGLAHSDVRRSIYDPSNLFEGLENYSWIPHNIIKINEAGLQLGNHYHPYEELFFTPTGGFRFLLAEEDNNIIKDYQLGEGARIYIPKNVVHRVTGEKGAIIMGWGTEEFNPKKMISGSQEVLKKFDKYILK